MPYIVFDKSLPNEQKIEVYNKFLSLIQSDKKIQSLWAKWNSLRKLRLNKSNYEDWSQTWSINILVTYHAATNKFSMNVPHITEEELFKIKEYNDIVDDISNDVLVKRYFWSLLEEVRKKNK